MTKYWGFESFDEIGRLMKMWLCGGIGWHVEITGNAHLLTKEVAVKSTSETIKCLHILKYIYKHLKIYIKTLGITIQ